MKEREIVGDLQFQFYQPQSAKVTSALLASKLDYRSDWPYYRRRPSPHNGSCLRSFSVPFRCNIIHVNFHLSKPQLPSLDQDCHQLDTGSIYSCRHFRDTVKHTYEVLVGYFAYWSGSIHQGWKQSCEVPVPNKRKLYKQKHRGRQCGCIFDWFNRHRFLLHIAIDGLHDCWI